MNPEPTVPQGVPERRRSRDMSLERGHPPTEVPGYEPERFLGVGAYGEVWVAVEKNTGRRVAIKFYAHRGGLDWSLLSREVEKLAFLFADRYVVQLVGVGWDADPPYYVMEYLEQGSLAERLRSGPLPVGEAVDMFHDVAVGLVHAHGKGVLHCDLKPGNILLDQDHKPRLADFGQSRLSHEQAPALGTLFYMAPEQADLEAVPDARWDVYALGALLYCMLTGTPPRRTAEAVEQLEGAGDLKGRLARYRQMIRGSRPPTAHRQVSGVDRALAEIVDRCVAADPKKRYPNVQAVLAALNARALQRARRPMMVLGAVGPVLLLLVVSLFAWWGFSTAVRRSEEALTVRALESNGFAAQAVARNAANELERRYEAVEQMAASARLREVLAETVDKPEMQRLLEDLSEPRPDDQLEPLRQRYREHPDYRTLQDEFAALIPQRMRPPGQEEKAEEVASWFFCDARGISAARVPESLTIGKDYVWRSYFYGGDRDREETWRPEAAEHVERTRPSAVFRSQAREHRWIVAISTPVFAEGPEQEFLGVVALTVEVGRFVKFERGEGQFAVLVDRREGDHTGSILQHPLFGKLHDLYGRLPDRFQECRLSKDLLDTLDSEDFKNGRLESMKSYRDPVAADPQGQEYDRQWLARMEPILVRGEPIGWAIVVQEAYDSAIGSTLAGLRSRLVRYGLVALMMIVVVVAGLWAFAIRMLRETSPGRLLVSDREGTETPNSSVIANAPTTPHREPEARK